MRREMRKSFKSSRTIASLGLAFALVVSSALSFTPITAYATSSSGSETTTTSTPAETAYYLVWDDFTMASANSYSVQGFSSWDVSTPTSTPAKANGGASYTDASLYSDMHLQRQFNETSVDFVWEFTVKADSALSGTVFDMRYQNTTAIRFQMNGSSLEAVTPTGNVTICSLASNRFATLKVEVSPANGKYTVIADGVTVAENLSFLNTCTTVDRMYVQTTDAAAGNLTLGTVRMYTGYYINEKFLNADTGIVSDEWTTTGSTVTAYKTGTQGPDYYSASMSNGATLSRDVSYAQDGAWVEYQLLIPESMSEFSMTLEDASGNDFKVATVNNQFGYYSGSTFVPLYTCETNLWYHIMLQQTDEGGMLYLNHKLKAEGLTLPFTKFTKISFEAGTGQAYLDDIVVKDWIPYPEDYVPTPVAASNNTDDILVGLQSCNLWVEGTHFGYDWLTQWDERTTYLGYYDETVVETADWELKWKVEHGIDYELFCWYRPLGSNDEPIKANRNGTALHEGYFNARYSDMMKFAITWECAGGPVSGSEDFRENVVPYWIEQYFKDDRYLLIDNKPVVGMYAVSQLMSYFGGTAEGVKAELDYLRQACVDAGFDGCYIIMSNSSGNSVANIEAAGFDGQYAYSWGTNSSDIEVQKSGMTSLDAKIEEAGGQADIIPVASMGWDARAWERTGGGYCTIEDYTSLLQWIKNTFMPTLDSDSLGSKMILLDNWNEFGEGHYIMPSNLYGFGYVDAVRNVFGNGTEHTDAVPTAAQLARINHMYIQDREVEKVDLTTVSDLAVLQGYYFETAGDLEGWSIATYNGSNLDVENLRAESGAMKGNTHLGDATYADPAVFSPTVSLNAQEAIQIKVRMKCSVTADSPAIYFITESDPSYSQAKSVSGVYSVSAADEDGYTEVTFDVSGNELWTGTVTQLRLDPMTVAGSFEVDSFEIMCKASTGDATVYINGEKVYNSTLIKLVNNTVMFPVEELDLLTVARWSERLDGSAVEVLIDGNNFYRFPYDSNTVVINGVSTALTQGASVIDGEIYVPVADIFNAEGYTVEWNETDKILSLTEDTSNEPYEVIKGYYFNYDTEGWMQGGTLNSCEWLAGALHGVAGDDNMRLWSPESSMGVATADVTHIRMRIKTTVENPSMSILCQLNTGSVTYPVTYEEGADGYAEVLIDCSTQADWANATILNRICVYPFTGNIGEECYIDSIELIKEREVAADGSVLVGYYFEESTDGFAQGGSTGMAQEDGALVLTAAADGQPRVWSSNKSGTTYSNAMNVSNADATHVRIRIRTDVASPTMRLYTESVDASGTSSTISYDVAYEAVTEGYAEVLVDLRESDSWNTALTLQRVGIFPFGASNNEELAGKVIYIDSVEVLDMDETVNPYVALKNYNFATSTESWTWGGSNVVSGSFGYNEDGTISLTANGTNAKFWSPEAEANYINVSLADLTHIRLRVKTTAAVENPVFDLYCYTDGATVTFLDVAYTAGEDGYAEVLIDCTETDWGTATTLNRLCLWPYAGSGAEETFTIDSVELLKYVDPDSEQGGTADGGTTEEPDVNGGDDGVGEVAPSTYQVLFGSSYFRNGKEKWSVGGTTGLDFSDGAIKVTASSDGQPRIWSTGETQGVTSIPLDIDATEATHLRIRLKTAVTGQNMAVICEYRDANRNKQTVTHSNLSYTASADSYSEILVDLTNNNPGAGYTLDRLGIFPYGTSSNSALADTVVYIGSVEILKYIGDTTPADPLKILVVGNSITQHAPSPAKGWLANWGMAATAPEKDYVHILESRALAANSNVEMHWVNIAEYEKYFYDWSLISGDYSRYADFDADILISAIGANVKNGANEGDSSYENDETFTKEKFKAILDYFNPGGDAAVIIGATPLTNTEIVTILAEAATAYNYYYVDMTDVSGTAYSAVNYESTLKEIFGVTSIDAGVLGHPGDDGMAAMADRFWTTLSPLVGTNQGEETDEVLKGYYFESSTESWIQGGSTTLAQADGALVVTAASDGIPRFWSCTRTDSNLGSPLNIAAADATHVRIRIRTDVENPTLTLMCDLMNGETFSKTVSYTASYQAVTEGYAEVLIDLSSSTDWDTTLTLGRLGIYALGTQGSESYAGKAIYIDSIEVLKCAGEDAGASAAVVVSEESEATEEPVVPEEPEASEEAAVSEEPEAAEEPEVTEEVQV